MHIRQNGRVIDRLVARIFTHSRNVGLYSARKELNVLGEVADLLAELALVPISQVHQIEPH